MKSQLENQFVSYEIAKKLKELGFNEPCFGYYTRSTGIAMNVLSFDSNFQRPNINSIISKTNKLYEGDATAPLYRQVEEWLFKQYNIFIDIKRLKVMTDPNDDLYVYYCEIGDFSSQHYKTPKQALKKGIEEALQLIK